ncbi:MAG: hypothetical protein OXR68_05740 [Alphaproteobacteria bacterium]|nr:hypothetical protein [Alphaproteobacteria bacterium]MDD9920106.1 hypothetical protein [Alphaproteobacteria bacterium]
MRYLAAFLLLSLIWGQAQAVVRLEREAAYPETPLQKCIQVENFDFDTMPSEESGYLLGWRLFLKSTCLKQKNLTIFYELLDPEGNSLTYKPLGKVKRMMNANGQMTVKDAVRISHDPIDYQMKFHIVMEGHESRTQNYPLHTVKLEKKFIPQPVPDPVVVKKEKLKNCFSDFEVKTRAIAENWHRTYVWWQLVHPNDILCKQPIYAQFTMFDAAGKIIEQSGVEVQALNRDVKEGLWHKEGIRTIDFKEVQRMEAVVGYSKNLAKTGFKTINIALPELENW